jgi:COP9 signalosome complex subunit 12
MPLARAIKKADLRAFDVALRDGEDEFIKRRVYLTLERGRDIALRNLLRKVFVAGGFEEAKEGAPPVRRTRIPVTEFTAAIQLSGGETIDSDEVECLLANMIYKVSDRGAITHTSLRYLYFGPVCIVLFYINEEAATNTSRSRF